MAVWSGRYLGFLVWLHWVDRRATSSFIVGITLQTAVLSFGLVQFRGESESMIVQGAVRAAFLVGTAVCGLSAMSAFQNEFRYQTIWQTARDTRVFSRLMLVRALAMVVITAPAAATPFVVAVVVGDCCLPLPLVAVTYLMALVVLTAYTHILTLGLALTYDPARLVPWIRQAVMIVALGTVTFLSPSWVRSAFPFVWVERMALRPESVMGAASAALGLTLLWWLIAQLLMGPAMHRVLERRFLDNVEGR